MSSSKPLLADVQCTRLKFEPGDRILVRTRNPTPMSKAQIKKLRKSVEKWSGGIAEVLIVQECLMNVEVVKKNKGFELDIPNQ